MKKLLKQFARSLNPSNYIASIKLASDTFASMRRLPISWDEAAVQLDQIRVHARGIRYPQYLYGLLCATRTAQAVGEKKFTAIEFGVAGGNGLVAMEQNAALIEQRYGISIDIIGFDNLSGLPVRTDPRDCPFAFQGGEFAMDEEKLRSRLKRAELRLGDVAETIRIFSRESFSPIGFVSNDLDLYTSTRDSLELFKLEPHRFLPRVTMYFDDLTGYPYTTVSGEWAAINEFNSISKDRQIGQIYGLKNCLGRHYRFATWAEMMFVLHVFDHAAYNKSEVNWMPDLSLR